MSQVDEKVGRIKDVTAAFEQRKFTPLLKKPLVSTGHVAGKGAVTLWITDAPEPTAMLVDSKEIRIYYPHQAVVEVYPIEGQLSALASSPLPRIDTLRQFFNFEKIAAASLQADATEDRYLAVRMKPIDAALREHVQEVKVLLDRNSGFIVRAENIDADDERTVLSFSDVRIDTGLADVSLQLNVPSGTRVSHPLEGLNRMPQRPKPAPGGSQ